MSSDLSRAYDNWHSRFEVAQNADAPWHRLVRSHLRPAEGSTVLEIGCGRGELSHWLSGQGFRVVLGADFSSLAVRMAADHIGSDGGFFSVSDIQGLPHRDSTFDVVISCETIEHVPSPREAVAELARVLRPGGVLYLTTPNYLSLTGAYRAYRRLVGRPFTEEGQPINNLTMLPRTIRWLRAAGLRPSVPESSGFYVPIPRRRPVPIRALDGSGSVTKWFGLHQLVVAHKPGRG